MYIAIAGNIGSGKTSLTQLLAQRFDARAYYEDIDNPYINDFYEDMNRWSFNFQMFFLGSRINQTLQMLNESTGHVVQDRTIHEDAHIFAGNLHQTPRALLPILQKQMQAHLDTHVGRT